MADVAREVTENVLSLRGGELDGVSAIVRGRVRERRARGAVDAPQTEEAEFATEELSVAREIAREWALESILCWLSPGIEIVMRAERWGRRATGPDWRHAVLAVAVGMYSSCGRGPQVRSLEGAGTVCAGGEPPRVGGGGVPGAGGRLGGGLPLRGEGCRSGSWRRPRRVLPRPPPLGTVSTNTRTKLGAARGPGRPASSTAVT